MLYLLIDFVYAATDDGVRPSMLISTLYRLSIWVDRVVVQAKSG